MKIHIKDLRANLIMIFTLFAFFEITFFVSLGTAGVLFAIVVFVFLCIMILYKLSNSKEISTILSIPILLSVFQNVYLGIFSPKLSSMAVQLLTVLNFILACMIFVDLFLSYRGTDKRKNKLFLFFILLIGYSFVSIAFLNRINILSIVSSFRNVSSVFVFFFIGYFSSKKLELRKFENIILFFGVVVMAVGIYDMLTGGEMWRNLNITDLWTKKGIRVQASGLPTNFYSSETINGERIRRMTSTFADPLNLGAFLFAVFCIAWHRKKRALEILMIVGMVLTVSKGAWLGLLIFMCVYAYYYFPRLIFLEAIAISGLLGMAFLVYAFRTSANSVFLHISGLTAAFKGLIRNPLGSGIGSNGVLAKQFSGFASNADVTETGLGMIISQLGIVGLFVYVMYFKNIIKSCMRTLDKRDAVFILSMVLSVVVNILFNEVALSPNSCATYFLIIGYVISIYDNNIENNNEEGEKVFR